MDIRNTESPENTLRRWRLTILDNFLTVAAILSLPAIAVIINNTLPMPKQWPVGVAFCILELLLIVLAVGRRLAPWVRATGLLWVGYAAAIINLTQSGLVGAAPLYLLALPILALTLIGKRAGAASVVVSLLLAGVTAVRVDLGLQLQRLPERSALMGLTTISMLIVVVMLLLTLFYRLQENLIVDQGRIHIELLHAQALLEEQNVTLEKKVEERTEEYLRSNKVQTALYEIANAMGASRDIQEFYAQVHHVVGELMYAGNFFIAVYDETSGLLSFPYFVDEKDSPFPTQPLEDFHGMTSYMIRTGNPIKHGSDQFNTLLANQEVEIAGTPNIDGVGAPLRAGDKVLGAIFVQSYTPGIHYTEQDEEILVYVAQHIATALTRLHALEAERLRNNELAILYSVSAAIAKTLDVRTMTRLVGDKVLEVFGTDSAKIMLLDRQTNLIHVLYAYDANKGGYIDYIEPIPLGTGLTSRVILSGQPLMLGTLEEELAHGAYFPPEIMNKGLGLPSQSWLGVPIIINDQALGLVSLADARPYVFGENHLRLLQTISANIGVAIENARLFQAEQQRAAELAAINTVSAALASELDLNVLLQLVGEQIRTVFNADIAYVALLDKSGQSIDFPYTYGEELTSIRYGEGLTSTILQSNQPLLINRELDRRTLEIGATVVGRDSVSYLGVPIMVRGQAVGALSVQSVTQEGIFTQTDARLLNTIAHNVGTALQNAHLYAEAQQARAAAEQANQAKSIFLANMSHELRTPLNSMLILARMLADNESGNLTEDQVESAQVITKSGADLLWLINEILDLSKVEAGKMELHPALFSLADLAQAIQLQFAPVAANKGIAFEIVLASNLPATIESDRQRVEQIIKNLLGNAFKFTEQGMVRLTLQRPAEDAHLPLAELTPATTIAISVSDTGIGMTPEQQQRIFKTFQQADGSTSRKYGGTGLGLTISRELAICLGGQIEVQSVAGEGSTFTLYLPERGVPQERMLEKSGELPVAMPSAWSLSPAYQGGGHRLLIIEDDATFAKLVCAAATKKGFSCVLAHDGESGLALAQEHHPDAIILDLKLPHMSGWDVLNALKQAPETRHIPVHIISGQEGRATAYQMGVLSFLSKPVTLEDLDRVFRSIENTMAHKIRTLLLVEEDANQRHSLRQLLMSGDVRIFEACSGAEALAAMRAQPFDCLFLDMVLPDMTGLELLKSINDDEIMPLCPVVVFATKDMTKEENAELLQYMDEVTFFLRQAIADIPQEQALASAPQPEHECSLSGKRVLIVDDDMRSAFALSKVLGEKGLQVNIAGSGMKALEMLAVTPTGFDIVLLDIMMPDLDGYETMRRIRAQARFESLPILALTAKAMASDAEMCMAAGANDYLTKPLDLDRLFSLLRFWLYR